MTAPLDAAAAPAPANPPPAGAPRVFVVAGMHRAGAAVVARGLQALGIDLGERLMSADLRMNARGFFEDLDVVALDDALLAACGADWKSVASLFGVDWAAPAHEHARRELRALLSARLARSGQFGFKDPRVPRLLPIWQDAFADLGAADAYVVAVRHPQSVIASLTARDDLDPRRSAWLWLVHLVCALHYTQGRPRLVVDYDRLLAQPRRELARIARAFALAPAVLESADVATYAGEFLSAELRHAEHAAGDPGAAGEIPLVAEAHALAQRLAGDEVDIGGAEAAQAIAALRAGLDAHAPLLGYAGAVERRADDVARLTGELAWAQSSLVQSHTYVGELERTLERVQADAREDRRAAQELIATAVTYSDALRAELDRLLEDRGQRNFERAGARLDRLRQRLFPRRRRGNPDDQR